MAESAGSSATENRTSIHEVIDARGKQILSALIDFIQPIAHFPSPSVNKTDDQKRDALLELVEGKKLLTSLSEFIEAVVRPNHPEQLNQVSIVDEKKKVKPSDIKSAQEKTPSTEAISDYLESQIVSFLGKHIFNNMPIRVLTFDSMGNNIKMIERSEVYSLVLESVCKEAAEPDFQAAWRKIQNMAGNVVVFSQVKGYIERRDREKRLINDLINHHSRYAILSHTWLRSVPGDVVYKYWDKRIDYPEGHRKVVKFCEVAAKNHSVRFGWMDNVCINKDSSSELDESIRSMYKWYRGSHVCISYMSQTKEVNKLHSDSWFTRGWTLQELLAPLDSHFYDMNWERFGHIGDALFQPAIERATTISKAELELCSQGEIFKIPISRRLQLASKRQVTREEDTAYSLMGILGVDISIAYGEGSEHAFFRLVRELLTTKEDVLDVFNHSYHPSKKLIPSTVANYMHRSQVFYSQIEGTKGQLNQWQLPEPISLTYMGLRMSLLLFHALKVDSADPHRQPMGRISGSVRMSFNVNYDYDFVEPTYSLLDKRIYTEELGKYKEPSGSCPLVVTFAVMNFGIEDDNILLPMDCFSVPLEFSAFAKGKGGFVRSTDDFKILNVTAGPMFEVSLNEGTRSVSMEALREHGIQLVTLYL